MTFIASCPNTFESVHIMTLLQNILCTLRVFKNKIDYFIKRLSIYMFLEKSFNVFFKLWGVLSLKHLKPHCRKHLFGRLITRPTLRNQRIGFFD